MVVHRTGWTVIKVYNIYFVSAAPIVGYCIVPEVYAVENS